MANVLFKLSTLLSISIIFSLSAVGQTRPSNWARTALTGTGLSIESPDPPRLDQDKPDPAIQEQRAYVRWSLSSKGVFATFVYEERVKELMTPRQSAEYYATLFAGSETPKLSRVTDVTYLGQPAAKLEQQVYDPYGKQEMFRTFIVFGTPGKLTDVNVAYPVGDTNSKAIAERVLASVQKAGATAAATLPGPAANWKKMRFGGLLYDTPNPEYRDCNDKQYSGQGFTETSACYDWGKAFILKIRHRVYPGAGQTPDPTKFASESLKRYKEIDAESKLSAGHEYQIKPFRVTGAEAAKLEGFMSVGTVGNRNDEIYVRKNNEFWIVSVIYPFGSDYYDEAVARILGSIALATTVPTVSPSNAATKADPFATGKELASKGEHRNAIEQFTAAVSIDPKNGLIYFYRAMSEEVVGDHDGAIRDYTTALQNGTRPNETYFNRGTVYLNQKKYSAAIADFSSSVKSDPKYYRSYYNRGVAYYQLGQTDKALADLTTTIGIDPKHTNSYILRAEIYCKKKLIVSAIRDEDIAISLGAKLTKRCGK